MSLYVTNRALKNSRRKGNARLLLLCLCHHASDAGECNPGVALLATESGMSERTVQRLLSELKDSGEVAIQPGGGRRNTHHFTVLVGLESWGGADVEQPAPKPKRQRVKGDTGVTVYENGKGDKSERKGDKSSIKGDTATSPEPIEPRKTELKTVAAASAHARGIERVASEESREAAPPSKPDSEPAQPGEAPGGAAPDLSFLSDEDRACFSATILDVLHSYPDASAADWAVRAIFRENKEMWGLWRDVARWAEDRPWPRIVAALVKAKPTRHPLRYALDQLEHDFYADERQAKITTTTYRNGYETRNPTQAPQQPTSGGGSGRPQRGGAAAPGGGWWDTSIYARVGRRPE
jgi:hypothetical protein